MYNHCMLTDSEPTKHYEIIICMKCHSVSLGVLGQESNGAVPTPLNSWNRMNTKTDLNRLKSCSAMAPYVHPYQNLLGV